MGQTQTKRFAAVTTMDGVKAANKEAGYKFFSDDNMRMFGCRIKTELLTGADGEKYFITEEDNLRGTARLFTVRRFNQESGMIDTIGDFNSFKTKQDALDSVGLEEDTPEEFEELDGYDQVKALYLVNYLGYTIEDALNSYEDVTFYPDMTLAEVVEEFINDGVWECSDFLKNYIDFDKLCQDLSYDGYEETNVGVFFGP